MTQLQDDDLKTIEIFQSLRSKLGDHPSLVFLVKNNGFEIQVNTEFQSRNFKFYTQGSRLELYLMPHDGLFRSRIWLLDYPIVSGATSKMTRSIRCRELAAIWLAKYIRRIFAHTGVCAIDWSKEGF